MQDFNLPELRFHNPKLSAGYHWPNQIAQDARFAFVRHGSQGPYLHTGLDVPSAEPFELRLRPATRSDFNAFSFTRENLRGAGPGLIVQAKHYTLFFGHVDPALGLLQRTLADGTLQLTFSPLTRAQGPAAWTGPHTHIEVIRLPSAMNEKVVAQYKTEASSQKLLASGDILVASRTLSPIVIRCCDPGNWLRITNSQ